MNENRFLWTKILIKIKTRDKKMFTKKFHEGGGEGGEGGGNFHGGKLTPEKCPLGKLPPGKLPPIPPEKKKKMDSRKNYLLGKM